jgi:hypothetical protein
MIIKEYKAPNPQWDISELICEKTGISIQKHSMNVEPHYTVYKIKSSGNYYDIMEEVFELIKKLIV